jgi:glucose/arabinose dehydrogenase
MMNDGFEIVADGFSFPTSVAFDDDGTPYIAESGLPFGGAPSGGRVWRLGPQRQLLAERLRYPVTGLVFHGGALFVSEGGTPGRISRLDLDGTRTTLLDHLPGPGNYHTNTVAFGPDGRMYFAQGALTNTGVVGLDAYELGWLRLLPHACDLPGYDVVLTGENFETRDPIAGGDARAVTGAFSRFGTVREAGQRLVRRLPCTAAVMRCQPDGTELELVAWGLRNAFGLGFLPDERLLAVDQGADDRGSRPIGEAPDLLFEVRTGAWYGWPDFIGGDPVTDDKFCPTRGPAPRFVIANHAELPPPERALIAFPSHTAAVKFDVGGDGNIYVALFGDEQPMTAPSGPRRARGLARIDPLDWSLHYFVGGAVERPIDICFRPRDGVLHIVDFGHFEMESHGVAATAGTGKLWRVHTPLATCAAHGAYGPLRSF